MSRVYAGTFHRDNKKARLKKDGEKVVGWRSEGIKIGKQKGYKKQIAKHKHQSVDRNRKLDSQEVENASSINDSLYFSCYSRRRKKRSGRIGKNEIELEIRKKES